MKRRTVLVLLALAILNTYLYLVNGSNIESNVSRQRVSAINLLHDNNGNNNNHNYHNDDKISSSRLSMGSKLHHVASDVRQRLLNEFKKHLHHLNNNNNKQSTEQIKKDLINTYSNVLIEEYQQRVNHKPMRHRPSKDCEHIQNVLFNFNCDVSDVHG